MAVGGHVTRERRESGRRVGLVAVDVDGPCSLTRGASHHLGQEGVMSTEPWRISPACSSHCGGTSMIVCVDRRR
ncbi:MAG: hypothetical protein QG671_3039 [Actinomycetota bacterium]|nr:hypothetical protein [Actinomycetota bacterium]